MSEIPNPNDTTEYMELEPSIAGMIHNLPWMGTNWTRKEREAWLKAFNAVCDMLYPDDDPAKHEMDAADAKHGFVDDMARDQMRARREPEQTADAISDRLEAAAQTKPPVAVPTPSAEIPVLAEQVVFDPQPYRGATNAARIVLDLIRSVGKSAHVWLRGDGRIKVAGEDFKPDVTDQLVGVYTPDVKKSAIAADLKAVAPK